MSLNVNIAAFIPKPHTPWERAAQLDESRAMNRIMAVKKGLAGDGFKIGYHAPILALLEGIVSRGSERAGDLVLDAYRRGARLDAWEEHIRLDVWREAIAAAGWDPIAETCRPRAGDEALPWESISLGLSTSVVAEGPMVHAPSTATEEPATPVSPAPRTEWTRVMFSYTKQGTAVYISHLDLMTVFERAVARAGYAARFTEGYNPKPRLEFANPLSLGLGSDQEIAALDLHDFDTAEAFVVRLNRSLPEGLRLTRVENMAPVLLGARRRSLMALYWGSDFDVVDASGSVRRLRLPSTGPSIRKALEAEGTWESSLARRTATWAAGRDGAPVSYFAVLAGSSADGAPAS